MNAQRDSEQLRRRRSSKLHRDTWALLFGMLTITTTPNPLGLARVNRGATMPAFVPPTWRNRDHASR